MSGGSGGPVIIHHLAQAPGVTPEDQAELQEIADRNPVECSVADAFKVLHILWKYLRP